MTAPRPRYPHKKSARTPRAARLLAVLLVLGSVAAVYGVLQNGLSLQEIAAGRPPQTLSGKPAPEATAPSEALTLPPVPEVSRSGKPESPYTLPEPVPHAAPVSPAPPATGFRPAAAEAEAPFADADPAEIARQLRPRFAGRSPRLWGERMDGVTSRLDLPEQPGRAVIALTFDACGGRKSASYDAGLIALLREHHIPATLFVTSLWIKNNRETLRELAADPLFEIAAHGARHRPCSVNGQSVYDIKGTASLEELIGEVEGNVRDIASVTGQRPRWFRSGTAYYDDVAADVIHALGLGIAGYSITGDQGATLSAPRVAARTLEARHGDILLFHMNRPNSGTREGLRRALPRLVEQGAVFVRLSDITPFYP